MSKRAVLLRRHFGSSSLRSAGVFDSTYGVQDEAVRHAAEHSSKELRNAMHRYFVIDAMKRGGDIFDAMARAGMQP